MSKEKGVLVLLFLVFCVVPLYGVEMVLRLQPFMPIQSSVFGVKIGAFEPCFGMDMGYISVSDKDRHIEWERDGSDEFYKYYESESNYDGSATLVIPRIGCRYYLPLGGACPYLSLLFFKGVPMVNAHYEHEYWYYDSTGAVTDHYKEVDNMDAEEDAIGNYLSFWGGTIGIGGEYFIKDNFSISGECDFNFVFLGGKYVDEDSSYYYKDKWENEMQSLICYTFTRFFINFYFGGGKKEE